MSRQCLAAKSKVVLSKLPLQIVLNRVGVARLLIPVVAALLRRTVDAAAEGDVREITRLAGGHIQDARVAGRVLLRIVRRPGEALITRVGQRELVDEVGGNRPSVLNDVVGGLRRVSLVNIERRPQGIGGADRIRPHAGLTAEGDDQADLVLGVHVVVDAAGLVPVRQSAFIAGDQVIAVVRLIDRSLVGQHVFIDVLRGGREAGAGNHVRGAEPATLAGSAAAVARGLRDRIVDGVEGCRGKTGEIGVTQRRCSGRVVAHHGKRGKILRHRLGAGRLAVLAVVTEDEELVLEDGSTESGAHLVHVVGLLEATQLAPGGVGGQSRTAALTSRWNGRPGRCGGLAVWLPGVE